MLFRSFITCFNVLTLNLVEQVCCILSRQGNLIPLSPPKAVDTLFLRHHSKMQLPVKPLPREPEAPYRKCLCGQKD
jgi:hypothetical protein